MSYRITYDEAQDGTMILKYSGDAQTLVDACAREARGWRESPKKVTAATAGMRKMMSLDPVVMMQIARERGIPHSDIDAIFKAARDRNYSRFRCVDDARYFGRRGK